MAGQPRKRALVLELEQRTRIRFEDDEHTMLDYVADWCEGKTLTALAAEIGTEAGDQLAGLTGSQITRMLGAKFGSEEVQRRLNESRRIFAAELVDRAIDDAESVAADKDEIAKLRVQNDARFWVAERFDRAQFGQPKQQGVVINIGALHIDAMRQRMITAPAQALLEAAAEAIDVEVSQ